MVILQKMKLDNIKKISHSLTISKTTTTETEMATKQKRPYAIASMEHGEWKVITRFKNYQNADDKFDSYCKKYPNAYLEIIHSI